MPDIDLSNFEFFSALSADQLTKVSAMAEEVEAESGAVLIEQGRVGQEAFVIVAGEAEVIVAGERVLSVGPGSLIGEMALLDARPRSATIRAVSSMELLRFDAKRFRALLDTMPKATVEAMMERSQQTRQSNLNDD